MTQINIIITIIEKNIKQIEPKCKNNSIKLIKSLEKLLFKDRHDIIKNIINMENIKNTTQESA